MAFPLLRCHRCPGIDQHLLPSVPVVGENLIRCSRSSMCPIGHILEAQVNKASVLAAVRADLISMVDLTCWWSPYYKPMTLCVRDRRDDLMPRVVCSGRFMRLTTKTKGYWHGNIPSLTHTTLDQPPIWLAKAVETLRASSSSKPPNPPRRPRPAPNPAPMVGPWRVDSTNRFRRSDWLRDVGLL